MIKVQEEYFNIVSKNRRAAQMDRKAETPERNEDIVYRLKQSFLTLSVEELSQLSESHKVFLQELFELAVKHQSHIFSPSRKLEESIMSRVGVIEEINTAIELVIRSREQTGSTQYVASDKSLDKTFGLPRKFSRFTGRDTELSQLRNNLGKTQLITQKISGTGGVGKSQLANYFAHQMLLEGYYKWVIWLTGSIDEETAKNNIQSQLANLASVLNVSLSSENNQYQIIYEILSETGRGVVIFDDAPNYSILQRFLPVQAAIKIDVIITTRDGRYFGPEIIPLSLDVFTLVDAKKYIRSVLNSVSDHDAKLLAETLGCYPLALTQAIACISDRRCAVQDYANRYSQCLADREEYLDEPVHGGDPYEVERQVHDRKFKTTMKAVVALSIKRVEEICCSNDRFVLALRVLKAVSYIAPETPIPIELLRGLFSVHECKAQTDMALKPLRNLSLLEDAYQSENFKIHQIVQDVIKLQHASDSMDLKLLENAFLSTFLYKWEDSSTIKLSNKILGHLCFYVSQFAKEVRLGSNCVGYLKLLTRLGLYYSYYIRDFEKGREYLEMAKEIYKDQAIIINCLGDDDLRIPTKIEEYVLIAKINEGLLFCYSHQSDEETVNIQIKAAEFIYIELLEKIDGNENLEKLRDEINLSKSAFLVICGYIALKRGDLDGSLRAFSESLEIKRKLKCPADIPISASFHGLAKYWQAKAKDSDGEERSAALVKAIEYYSDSIDIRLRVNQNGDNTNVGQTHRDLAGLFYENNDIANCIVQIEYAEAAFFNIPSRLELTRTYKIIIDVFDFSQASSDLKRKFSNLVIKLIGNAVHLFGENSSEVNSLRSICKKQEFNEFPIAVQNGSRAHCFFANDSEINLIEVPNSRGNHSDCLGRPVMKDEGCGTVSNCQQESYERVIDVEENYSSENELSY